MRRLATLLHPARETLVVVLAAVWTLAYVLTHMPEGGMPRLIIRDVTLHFFGYLGLGAVLMVTLLAYGVPTGRRDAWTIGILAAYGAFDEMTQPLVNRWCAWQDWAADVLGAVAAVLIGEIIVRIVAHLARRTKA